LKASEQSRHYYVFTAANFKFSFYYYDKLNIILTSFDLEKDSNTGLIRMQGGQVGLQKSTASAGVSLISLFSWVRF